MKISNRKTIIHKRIITTLLAIVAIVVAGLVLSYTQKIGPFSTSNQSSNMSPEDTSRYEDSSPSSDSKDAPTSSNSVKTHGSTSEEANTAGKNAISITSAQELDDIVRIRTLISDITSDGTCNLLVTSNGKTYTDAADVQALANSSTCKGFEVPTSSLPSGTWNITVDYTVNDIRSSDTWKLEVEA